MLWLLNAPNASKISSHSDLLFEGYRAQFLHRDVWADDKTIPQGLHRKREHANVSVRSVCRLNPWLLELGFRKSWRHSDILKKTWQNETRAGLLQKKSAHALGMATGKHKRPKNCLCAFPASRLFFHFFKSRWCDASTTHDDQFDKMVAFLWSMCGHSDGSDSNLKLEHGKQKIVQKLELEEVFKVHCRPVCAG